MIDRFKQFPRALASQSRSVRLADGSIPALLAHPDWSTPAPVVVWLHGRTVSKELDPGRYLRWIRAGIAACAIDLPGHGERLEEDLHSPRRTLDVLERLIPEIDHVVEALASPEFGGVFDLDRMGIGGMSAGGMAALRRLCDPHPFACAAVEGTTGNLDALYFARSGRPWPIEHPRDRVSRLDPMRHLETWRPLPLLVLHSESDRLVPFAGMLSFVDALRAHNIKRGAPSAWIELVTWPETGAPDEHSGFGRFSNDAKNAQVEFLKRALRPGGPPAA